MKEFVRLHKRAILLGLAAALVVAASIGGTLAWLTSSSFGLVNTFTPGAVDTTVDEKFPDNETKKDVYIVNGPDANVPAFIRVALVPIWRNADHTGAGYPAAAVDVSGQMGTGWFYQDGYYYYSDPVPPLAKTGTALISSLSAPPAPAGVPADVYYELQVVAQSIQAEGVDSSGTAPATLAWGVTVSNGKLAPTMP